jgi:hypothetical protein
MNLKHYFRSTIIYSITTGTISLGAVAFANTDTPKLMRRALKNIQILVPYSLDSSKFSDSSNRDRIKNQLRLLVTNTEAISNHFKTNNSDSFFIGFSMAKDAKEAEISFSKGDYNQSKFILHHITDNCVSCHTKLKSKNSVKIGENLFSNIKNKNLSGSDLAHYRTVTRQFGKALEEYEQSFLNLKNNFNAMDFGRYLKIALRVKSDPERVQKLLKKLEKKRSADKRLLGHIRSWNSSIGKIISNKSLSNLSLENSRKLIEMASKAQSHYYDSRSIVYLITASTVLNSRLLKETKQNTISEIYMLLGEIEDRMPQEFWVSETEHFLEKSIRTSPKSIFAKRSLGILEDRFVFEFTGSSGTNIPNDVELTLKDLRALVSGSKKVNR